MNTEFGELDASQEWEIGEPLRRSIMAIPLQPGATVRDALSEAKPFAEDALTTLEFLEEHRPLSEKEHRQADALERFLAALEEAKEEIGAR